MTFSLDSLDRRYRGLQSKDKKGDQISEVVRILLIASLVVLFGSIVISDYLNFETSFEITIAVLFVLIGVMVFLMSHSNKYIIKSEDFRFYRIYDSYILLQTYSDTKLEEDKGKAVKSIILLANLISSWTNNAPKDISELPDLVSKKLKGKLVPAIKQEKFDIISVFINRLFNVLIGLADGDIKLTHLKSMEDDLQAIKIEEAVKEKKGEPLTAKIWRLKYALIIGGSVPLFTTSQVLQEVQIGQILEKVLFFALALIAVLVTLYAIERRTFGRLKDSKFPPNASKN